MDVDRGSLPSDPDELKDLVVYLYRQFARTQARLQHLEERMRRPQRPEARPGDDSQGFLFDEILGDGEASDESDDDDETGDEEEDASTTVTRGRDVPRSRQRRGKRAPIPPELPRKDIRHEIPSDDPRRICPCCGELLEEIGVRVSEQLERVPAHFIVLRHQQVLYGCRKHKCDEKVARGEKPAQPIERGILGPGMLAYIVVSHFADHIPYYRLCQILERMGIHLTRGTLSRSAQSVADLLEAIVDYMFDEVRRSRRIHTDDSTYPILDPGAGKTWPAKIWPYVGDEDHPHTVYQVTWRRTRDGPREVLAGYRGALQADAYSGYDCIYASGEVVEVACWAHARRKLESCGELGAHQVLALIKAMYDHEEIARGLGERDRMAYRAEHVVPILERIRQCRDRLAPIVRPKSELATAIGYISNQWDALCCFASTGHLEPDNNIGERAIRGVAIGRRNWLFGGNFEAARRNAILMSLVESCARAKVNTFEYFRDVMVRISTHPHSRIAELTPAGWKAAREAEAESVVAGA